MVGVDAAQHVHPGLGGEWRGGDGAALWPPQQRLQPVAREEWPALHGYSAVV